MNYFAKGGECESGAACNAAFSAASSLDQGKNFQNLTVNFHGGKRTHKNRKHRMSGGAMNELASYDTAFNSTLPQDMRGAADVGSLDQAFSELPKFQQTGGSRRRTRGGSYFSPAPIETPSMLLGPGEEVQAFLNPQWYNENVVNPNFKGPENALVQKGGRKSRKASRKSRKASRKSRKASRKSRKASRKSRKASRKSRK
jgi:hypothetical protein